MMGPAVYVSEACRIYIGMLFAISAGHKALALPHFEKALSEALNLRGVFLRCAALAVIVSEALVVALLILGGRPGGAGVVIAFVLTVGFTGFIATMLIQGKSIQCACFGRSDEKLSALDLLRNGLLIAACIFYYWATREPHSLPFISHVLLAAIASIALLLSVSLKAITRLLAAE